MCCIVETIARVAVFAFVTLVWHAPGSEASGEDVTNLDTMDKTTNIAISLCALSHKKPISQKWLGSASWNMADLRQKDQFSAVYRAIVSEAADKQKSKIMYVEYAFQCGKTPKVIAVSFYPKDSMSLSKQDGGTFWHPEGTEVTIGGQKFRVTFDFSTGTFVPIITPA